MKKLVLTMASLVMLASMAFAQNETPMLPEHHGATDNQPAWGSSQTFNLAAGWNWWSTYINVTDIATLENALTANGLVIKSSNSMVENVNGTWSGQLTTIDLSKMYAIQMAADDNQVRLRGTRANASDVAIAVSEGWNWTGYPVTFEAPVSYALADYAATDGDAIKSSTKMAEYNAANQQWVGTLDVLEPGIGYKILSNSATTFTFPIVPASSKGILTTKYDVATEWQPVMASNPNNMNMVAVVSLDNEELRSENIEIGVFNGETCRGAIRPMYVDFLDQYVVFLTMYGEENEPFSFRLLDETGNVYESNEASISFHTDAMIGKLRSPFNLNFSSKASMTAGALNLFPNPVNRGEMVNLTLPAESTVEVINVLGSTMKRVRMAEGTQLAADMAPGIYTIKVTDAEGKVYVDKLIVK
jgi:hypothetical protein